MEKENRKLWRISKEDYFKALENAKQQGREEEIMYFRKFKEILLDAVKSNFKGEWHSRYFEEQMFKAEQKLKTQKEE